MKLGDAFPGKYLKAGVDVSETGDTFIIDRCESEELGQGSDKQIKPVIYFKNEEKGFVLNKTNFKTIVELTGQGDSDDWEGVEITLFSTEVQFGADMVESIRVKKKVSRTPANSKAAAATAETTAPAPAPAKTTKPGKETQTITPNDIEVMDVTPPKGDDGDDDDPPF